MREERSGLTGLQGKVQVTNQSRNKAKGVATRSRQGRGQKDGVSIKLEEENEGENIR